MAQGRVSATAAATVTVVALLCLVLERPSMPKQPTTLLVMLRAGLYNVVDWPKGKSFEADDVPAFKYDPSYHNVVPVNQEGFVSCSAPPHAKVYTSGGDHITLLTGVNYFICNFPGHFQHGMMIAAFPVPVYLVPFPIHVVGTDSPSEKMVPNQPSQIPSSLDD